MEAAPVIKCLDCSATFPENGKDYLYWAVHMMAHGHSVDEIIELTYPHLRTDMILQDFECGACGNIFEKLCSENEEPLSICPKCTGHARQIISFRGLVKISGSDTTSESVAPTERQHSELREFTKGGKRRISVRLPDPKKRDVGSNLALDVKREVVKRRKGG